AIVHSLEKSALRDAAERRSLEGAEAPSGAEQTTEEANAGEGHLLFVPTTAGYVLVGRNGPAPPDGDRVKLRDQAASFRVAKLGASPLPHDPRICAYLDRPLPTLVRARLFSGSVKPWRSAYGTRRIRSL